MKDNDDNRCVTFCGGCCVGGAGGGAEVVVVVVVVSSNAANTSCCLGTADPESVEPTDACTDTCMCGRGTEEFSSSKPRH